MTDRAVMQQALDALEAKGDPWIVLERKAITAMQEALAQPQQEACPTCGEYEPRTGTCGTSPNDKRALCNRRDTSPPAQEIVCSTGLCHYRKPLTDEEIETVWRSVQANDFHDCVKPFARAIEAKHNIKGDA